MLRDDHADWWPKRTCLGLRTELFFPPPHCQYAEGKEVCNSCPVTGECLDYALKYEGIVGRRDGLYGGLTPEERHTRYGRLHGGIGYAEAAVRI